MKDCPVTQWDRNEHVDSLAKSDYLLFCLNEGAISLDEFLVKIKPINERLQALRQKVS